MNIVVAGGGTAGHINPAITIANTIKQKCENANILFLGNKDSLEQKLVTKAGYDIKFIRVTGLKRSLSLHNAKALAYFLKSVADCKKILKDFKADVVIGTGGYVSGPVVYAAHSLGIKTAIHEQNAYPGVTSRFLSRFVDTVFISFESSRKYFDKAKNVVLTGNPLDSKFLFADKAKSRKELGIPDDAFYVLSFAGSLGAREINKVITDVIIKNDAEKDFYHTHATGSFGYKWMPGELLKHGFDVLKKSHIDVLEYIYDMPLRLAACDVVVSRAGAITLGEITAQGKASILIPSPNVTNNHQYHNAMSLVNAGAAKIIEEKDLTANRLYDAILEIKKNPDLAKSLGKNASKCALLRAAEEIYNGIIKLI